MKKETHYAGLWIRLIADFIDSTLLDIVTCLVGLMVLGVVFWIRKVGLLPPLQSEGSILESLESFGAQVFLVVTRSLISFGYFSWATYRFGTTLGKRPLRIYVVSVDHSGPVSLKQSILRCLGYIISYIPFGAGFLMVGFQPEKRGLHDLIAGTMSIVKPKAAFQPQTEA